MRATSAVPPTADPNLAVLELDVRPGTPARAQDSRATIEVDVPADAVASADVAGGGWEHVDVIQTAGPSGASAGGSGHLLYGSYLVRLTDSQGRPASHGLRRPLRMRLLPGAFRAAWPGSGVRVFTRTAGTTVESVATLGADGAMSADVAAGGAASAVTFAASSPVSVFGTANAFTADVGTGSLTAHYPIDVPSGPGGLAPPLSLDYNSALVAEQHNPMAAAGWVGEGFDLSAGEITWSENLTGSYWANSWHLQDPYGLADELIPPTVNTSTYYDDRNGTSITAGPIRWHTATESHTKIYSYTGPLTLPGMSAHPPCFRVFLPNGLIEEYGCTMDSLRYYPSGSRYFVSGWLLDLITDPNGNQIHLTYQQDTAEAGSSGTMKYPRDAVLSTVEWDSPGCVGSPAAQAPCTQNGAASNTWAPLMRVSFAATHAVARFTGKPTESNENGCNTLPMRCDDPWYTDPPLEQQTFVLNDALVQVRGSATAAWQTLRDYQFTYEQTGVSQFQDPWTGANTQGAGKLDLTALKVVGDDGTTSEPTRTFTYTPVTQYYTDLDYGADPGPTVTPMSFGLSVSQNNCGPSWNWTPTTYVYWMYDNSGTIWDVYDCPLWSESVAGNSSYLATASNGLGLAQTFSWANAYPNVEGVPTINGGADVADPLFCDGHESTGPCGSRSVYQEWSRAVLTAQSSAVVRASSAGNRTVTSTTSYRYRLTTPVKAQTDCDAGSRCFLATMYFRPLFHFDAGDFHDEQFMGFAEADVTDPDGSVEKHHYHTTMGIGMYDTSIPCVGDFCHASPWWSPDNALHGKEYEDDVYDVDGTTLLSKTTTNYSLICPPAGVSGSPSWTDSKDTDSGFPYTFTWDGQLVSELDNVDPVAVCDIQTSQTDSYTWDGAPASAAVPHTTTTYAYDGYGRVTSVTSTGNEGGAIGSATSSTTQTSYVWNDSLTATATGVTGTYLIDEPAATEVVSADGSRHTSCEFTGYDGQPYTTGQTAQLTRALATTSDTPADCGTSAGGFTTSGDSVGSFTYDRYGNLVANDDPDSNAGDAAHRGCTLSDGTTAHSLCLTADPTFAAMPVAATNARGQVSTIGFGTASDPAGGFGLWPLIQTDANGQTTRLSYDGLGRPTGSTLPGETSGSATTTTSYTSWCSGTGAQTPCLEVDQVQRTNDSTTVTSRTFYDGWGNPVETRSQAPDGRDLITYTYYDPSGHVVFQSAPYFVPAYTGVPGVGAFAVPDAGQVGSTTTYVSRLQQKGLDANSFTTTVTTAVVCALPGLDDPACYAATTTLDPLGHESASYTDAFGRDIYDRTFSGNGNTGYIPYATTRTTYDIQGNVATVMLPGGTDTARYTYDDQGRPTIVDDPQRGTSSYAYDPNGNLTEVVDARGSAGTTYIGYDGLDRPLWRNTTSSSAGAYVTYTYDGAGNGNPGAGRLTGESFTGGADGSLSGSYTFGYDVRGEVSARTVTVAGTAYTVHAAYDDAGNLLSLTYPSGTVVSDGYAAGAWLTGVSRTAGGATTALLSGASYSGAGGAGGMMTGATLADGALAFSATYDNLGQLTDTRLSRTTDQSTLFEQARTFDGAGNVTSAATTLPQGTDRQSFCYDEQDRLVWAGTTGTPPCATQPIVAGTLGAAAYQHSYGYDTQDRFTTGPLGAYYFTDRAHGQATTAAGGGYTTAYDAAGDQTCRDPAAPGPGAGCAGTAMQLRYDNEARLIAARAGDGTASGELYDGDGNRVAQTVTTAAGTTTTVYVGTIAEYTTAPDGSTSSTEYYRAGGGPVGVSVNGATPVYLATDGLGSPGAVVDAGGNVLASVLYGPYGAPRYVSGTMHTDRGYTGQISDASTGLDYYGARYYDPTSGQFVSADPADDGPNRYAYARANPETFTDPTGLTAGDINPQDFVTLAKAEAEDTGETLEQWKQFFLWVQLVVVLGGSLLQYYPPKDPTQPGAPIGGPGTSISAQSPAQGNTQLSDDDAINREKEKQSKKEKKEAAKKARKGDTSTKQPRPASDDLSRQPAGKNRAVKGVYRYVAPSPPPAMYTPAVSTITATIGATSISNPIQTFNTSSGGQVMDTPWSQPAATPTWNPPPPSPPLYIPPPPVVTPSFVAPVYTPTVSYQAPVYAAPFATPSFDPFGFFSGMNLWALATVALVAVALLIAAPLVISLAPVLFDAFVPVVAGAATALGGAWAWLTGTSPSFGY